LLDVDVLFSVTENFKIVIAENNAKVERIFVVNAMGG
jgi:hypothetical protein